MKSCRKGRSAVAFVPSVGSRQLIRAIAVLAAFGWGFSAAQSARAQAVNLLHSFGNSSGDGAFPVGGVIKDTSGNLYGTTQGSSLGGPAGGTVFELVKSSSGSYSEKLLYGFSGGADGSAPSAGLVMDASGNLFGTTQLGGANGAGTVFELVNSSGNYSEKVLYSFSTSGSDGQNPVAGVVLDASGNLFGSTQNGGASFGGTVFELVNSSGNYSEKVLYSFVNTTFYQGSDGWGPVAGVIMDASGNLFGTTHNGGGSLNCPQSGCGTVFELVNSSGNYSEKILHAFSGGADGSSPSAGLIMDASGNLFSTASFFGANGSGTVFELVNSSGNYSQKILYTFSGGADGGNPSAGLIMDASGNLFSTTQNGGANGAGTVFELVNSSGNYSEKVLHSFSFSACDGELVSSGVIMDASGTLYGTTQNGGPINQGTVYEIIEPSGAPTATTTTIFPSPNPVAVGNPVSFTATVTSSKLFPATGTVAFSSPSVNLGTLSLSCGSTIGTVSVEDAESIGGIGANTITAQYTPDVANFAPSTGMVSETVNESGVVLTSGNNTLTGNQTINGSESVNGNMAATSLTIGGGTPITQCDSATFTMTVPSLTPGACTAKTYTWSAVGSGTNDTIALGVPNSFLSAGGILYFQASENASNTLMIRACNVDPQGPPSSSVTGSIRVDLIKH